MPKIRITKSAINNLAAPDPSGRQRLYWDRDLRGFGLLCSGTTNSKTYVVQSTVNGRSRRVTVGPANVFSIEKARARAIKLLAQMAEGVDPKAKRRAEKVAATAAAYTLRNALDDYLGARKALRTRTASDYRSALERHLTDWLDKPHKEIDADAVERRHMEIQKEVLGRKQSHLTTGHASANGAMRALRAIWNHAQDRQPELPSNPVRRLRRSWFPQERRTRSVKQSALPVFYAAVQTLENTIMRDLILLLLFTGLRRGEAAALRWAEVDLAEKVIRLSASRTKAGRALDLPMSDVIYDLLVARRAIGDDGPWVFPSNSRSGHVIEPGPSFKVIFDETGIKVSSHDLRRTFITVAESTEIPIYALKGLVNHSYGSDVTAGYIVSGPERLREPMQRVTDRLKTLCGIDRSQGENVAKISR